MRSFALLFALMASFPAFTQDDLLEQLDSEGEGFVYTSATFKGQRLVNGQTVETVPGGDLQFIFAHRFAAINTGLYEFFGLDQAFVRIGLEYGITDRFGVGLGRNSVDKTVDSYLRYKLVGQKSGAETFPLTATFFGSVAAKVSPRNEDLPSPVSFNDRLAYTTQLLLARKFSSAVSLQLMPTIVHKNLTDGGLDRNTTALMGIGGRLKITRSAALTSGYYYRFGIADGNPFHNPIGFGIDIETGGHVFQLVFTNTRGLTERAYLTETSGNFFDGDIHFGFNVTRMFSFKRERKP